MKIKYLTITFLLVSVFLFSCSDDKISPEDEIRQYIENIRVAAEERNHRDVADLVDESYADQQDLKKKQLIKKLRAYFFTHKNIHLYTQIESIVFQSENKAFVTLHVAMTGNAIKDINALNSLRAQVYRFELLLTKNNYWLLKQARWQQTSIKDLL